MRVSSRRFAPAMLLCAALSGLGAPAFAADDKAEGKGPDGERPLFENWPDILGDPEALDEALDGEKLSQEAREAVERLLQIVEPMMDQLSIAIRDLPRYEAPVILRNGDILIRRKRDEDGAIPPGDDAPAPHQDEAPEAEPDGSIKL